MIRNSISPAVAALLAALLPSGDAVIERVRSVEWKALTFSGERIEIEFKLPDAPSRERAAEIARRAPDMDLSFAGGMLAELDAVISADRLSFMALVVHDG